MKSAPALDMAYIQVYALHMAIVWDRTKARKNVAKHGVRFADAVLVLDDPYAITLADNESEPAEARWVTLGADAQGRVLVVVYIYRGEDIRLISARPAEPRELKEYEAQE
ncbi:MAG: BrnT family toxin [Terriglobia bacterium]